MSAPDGTEWTYYENDYTQSGGSIHGKSYSLRNGIPAHEERQPALTVGYNAAVDGAYTVTVTYGYWTDSIPETEEGFVEAPQGDNEIALIGAYDTEAEAQQAMLAFTQMVTGGIVAFGEHLNENDPDIALPTPVRDAQEAYRSNAGEIADQLPN